MPNRQYEQGTRFERKVRDDLHSRGFTVLRSAGSKGESKVDLVAVKPGIGFHPPMNEIEIIGENETKCSCHNEHLWIQCKRTGTIPPEEWNTLFMWAGYAGTTPILAENPSNGRGIIYWELTDVNKPYTRVKPKSLYVFRDERTIAP